jgi:hypothetical protein
LLSRFGSGADLGVDSGVDSGIGFAVGSGIELLVPLAPFYSRDKVLLRRSTSNFSFLHQNIGQIFSPIPGTNLNNGDILWTDMMADTAETLA